MKITATLFLGVFFSACNGGDTIHINTTAPAIIKNINPPQGYRWVNEINNSFEFYLQNISLKPQGSPILDYAGNRISNQSEHVAILDYDIGTRDLQQCADAVIRLRAEYLYKMNRFDEIGFHFTSGDFFTWNQYKSGVRAIVGGPHVYFENIAAPENSRISFRKYLDAIYNYAGTISLFKETMPVLNDDEIKPGDILITPGSPGHAIIIVGRAKNSQGKSVYLLAEGYTPAQSIHVITNTENENISPWYILSTQTSPTYTARYIFTQTNIRSF